jgi:hypothetical protein
LEKLIVSLMRFSTAVTLLGMEQLENAMSLRDGEDVSKATERFRATLDSFTDTVSKELDHKKQTTLKSVTRMSKEAVHRAVAGMNVVDPRELLRSTSDLMRKTSDSVADLVTKGANTVGKSLEEDGPASAAQVSSKHKVKKHPG